MKIVIFIFIQFSSLLFYYAHANNIKPASASSIEHTFFPSVTINNDRKTTEPKFTISTINQRYYTKFRSNGVFDPINIPFTVKGTPNNPYELVIRRAETNINCKTEGDASGRPFGHLSYLIDNYPFPNNSIFRFENIGDGVKEHTLNMVFKAFPDDDFYIKKLLKNGGVCGGEFDLYVQTSGL